MSFVAAAGLAVGVAGAVGKGIGRAKANRELRRLSKLDPQYQINPEAQKRLGLAQTLLNARSPGAVSAERNIYSTQANTMANAQRGATSSSQLLSLGGDVQGSTNQAFEQLGQQEAADYQRRYGNLEGAQEGMIREEDKVFQDKERRYNNSLQVAGAINENRQNTWGDISNAGFAIADFGMNKGMGGGKKPDFTQGFKYAGTGYTPKKFNPSTGKFE